MSAPTRTPVFTGRSVVTKDLIQQNRFVFLVVGIAMVMIGVTAIGSPLISTVTAKIFFGWLLLVSGLIQMFLAFSMRKWTELVIEILLGVQFALVGAWLVFYPPGGILALTVILGGVFIIQGTLEIVSALRMRPGDGWVWRMVAGIIALMVGLAIIARFPSSALWAIGALFGISFICTGAAYVLIALIPERQS
jgi:uncharacterized membrane protein HdeD (DUF308 family)